MKDKNGLVVMVGSQAGLDCLGFLVLSADCGMVNVLLTLCIWLAEIVFFEMFCFLGFLLFCLINFLKLTVPLPVLTRFCFPVLFSCLLFLRPVLSRPCHRVSLLLLFLYFVPHFSLTRMHFRVD